MAQITATNTPAPLKSVKTGLPLTTLFDAQGKIIDSMAAGVGLSEILGQIALLIERVAPPCLCSILLLDRDGKHLHPAAAPNLPDAYCEAIDGVEIGPNVGSCGTAAFRKEPVIVTDIATDPLWEGPREFALSFGLCACWSMPIIRADGVVLGTVAMYYTQSRRPAERDFSLLECASKLIRLALAHNRREEELRESEARLALAAEAAGLGTYDVDIVTMHDVWSDQLKVILGLDVTAKPSARLITELIHPEDRERFRARLKEQAGLQQDIDITEEFRIVRANDGQERVIRLMGRVLRSADGKPSRTIGTVADVTEQRRQEDALMKAKQAAEQANHGKSALLASVSHELRTPLNAILGFSDAILADTWGPVSPPRYREYIEDIHTSGGYLLSLINDVLDLEKLTAGKQDLILKEIDLGKIATGALRLIERKAADSDLTLEPLIQGGVSLIADERAVLQILTNLLANAVKFTPPGGRVTVFARRMPDASVSLGVKDNGVGMSPDDLHKALEPFGQVDPAIRQPERGTGLGLPIVKALIEAHGAVFHIESALGIGTRVWGVFPSRLVTTKEVGKDDFDKKQVA